MTEKILRKKTKEVKAGGVAIGGGAPVVLQSMTKSRRTKEIIKEIKELQDASCELVRIAVPDFEQARELKKIKKEVKIPVVADIHFNYRLAVESIKAGADKIRINPGNIGDRKHVKEIIKYAQGYKIPIRIGINSGSLETDLRSRYGVTARALYESAKRWVNIFEDYGFTELVISLKSENPLTTIEAYRKASEELNYPLHLGVTAASGGIRGLVKSAIGIGVLLYEGIGDTIRVSLTGPSIDEVKAGNEILKALGLKKGLEVIACPMCARCEIDVEKLSRQIEKRLSLKQAPCVQEPRTDMASRKKSGQNKDCRLKIAVMGCVVNGPGEAKDADFGVAGSGKYGFIFKKGKIIRKVPENKILDTLFSYLDV